VADGIPYHRERDRYCPQYPQIMAGHYKSSKPKHAEGTFDDHRNMYLTFEMPDKILEAVAA
jgi:hypothetical protein